MNRKKKLEKKIREKKRKKKRKKAYVYLPIRWGIETVIRQAAAASVRSGNSNSKPQLTRETSTAHAGKLPGGKHRRNVPSERSDEESRAIRILVV